MKRTLVLTLALIFTIVLAGGIALAKGSKCNEFTFDATKSKAGVRGQKLHYFWDFGDGGTATGAKAVHTYAKAGKYKVTLTVDDNTGSSCSSSSTCIEANIHANPEAAFDVRSRPGKPCVECTTN